ncbi:sugar porter family MFS transporter [uncultured Porphyromonas sp.]|uniref:sugar porter family MFS transporter n=1 Tax=uncultured Porphyromonas sp. TaxID=159274 RepID=UPI002606B81A|nr:sugar porter family MFS transporter [uncultured Porphyromonas sp.]
MEKKETNYGYLLFLAIIAALGGFLFGYDTAVISGTIPLVVGQYGLDTMSQGWYVGCALVGSIIGVLCAGILSDGIGRKWSMLLSAVLFTTSAVGCAVCHSFDQLVVYRIIGGMGIGVVSIVSPLYISEISIPKYRGRMVALYQLAVTIGFLGAYLINFALLRWSSSEPNLSGDWMQLIFSAEVWRGMLGMETIPALLFLVAILFIPESPRWLILRHKDDQARAILRTMHRDPEVVESQMSETRAAIAATSAEQSSLRLLREPAVLRPVLIGVAIAMLGQFMGVNAVLYYGPSIFEGAGLAAQDSLWYQVWIGIVNVLTTMLAIFLIDKVGRKTLVYYGVSGMIVSLVLIGLYFLYGETIGISSTWLLVFFLAYIFFCAGSISAVIFVFLSEMYPTRIRGLAMSLAGLSLWIGTYLIGQLTPWMLETLTPSGTFFLFALMCLPYLYIVWRLMPETTGKSLEEIERFWFRSTPSR